MSVTIKEQGDITIIYLEGMISVEYSVELEQELERTLDAGTRKIVIDLSQVELLSSSGLRTLISAQKRAKTNKYRLVLCGFSQTILKVIKLVELETLFEIYNSLDEALNSFTE